MNDRLNFYGDPSVSGGSIRVVNNKIVSSVETFKEDLTLNIQEPNAPHLGRIAYDTLLGGSFVATDIVTNTTTGVIIGEVISDNGTYFVSTTTYGTLTVGDAISNGTGVTAVITAITLNSNSRWGLEQTNLGAKAIFDITNDVFSVITSYKGSTTTIVVPWLDEWTDTPTDFTIKWTGFSVEFLVNGIQPVGATLLGADTRTFINDASVPKVAMSAMVENLNLDNLDVLYIENKNIQGFFNGSNGSVYSFYNIRPATILTNSYVAGQVLGLGTISSGTIRLNNQLILYVHFTKGSLTTGEITVEFSDNGIDGWVQETYDDITASTGISTERNLIRTFGSSGHFRIPIQMNDKYVRISAHGTGTVTSSSMSIDAIIGNN